MSENFKAQVTLDAITKTGAGKMVSITACILAICDILFLRIIFSSHCNRRISPHQRLD